MQFSYALIAAAACAVVNAVIITNGPASFVGVQAGKTFNITWSENIGPVTLTLKTGEANALTTVSTIASGLTGGSYGWAIPSTLPVGTYALEIQDSTSTPNYSVRFEITGGPAASSSSSASGSTTSTASSASASATTTGNSTITSSSSSATGSHSSTSGSASKTSTSTSATSTSTSVPNSNSGASAIASPLAFVLLAFAALMTLN